MRPADARRALGVQKGDGVVVALDHFEELGRKQARRILNAENVDDAVERWARLVSALEIVASANAESRGTKTRATSHEPHEGPKRETVRWPKPLAEDIVRQLLRSWAAEQRGGPHDLFQERLTLSNASVAEYKVHRLFESRHEEQRIGPGDSPPPVANAYDESIGSVELPPPTAVRAEAWEFIRSGSISTRRCSQCQGGRQRCGRCGGSGVERCRTTERCDVCFGSGEVSESPRDYSSRKVRCTSCHGRGQMACRKCGGSGRVPCTNCASTGYIDCTTCDSTGLITSYGHGLIKREVRVQSAGGVPAESPFAKAAGKARWQHALRSGHRVPDGLPRSDADTVKTLLRKQRGEMLRELDVAMLPVTEVEYDNDGQAETLYIVGTDRQIVAPAISARRRRRIGLLVGAALLAIGGVVGALYLFGAVGDDRNDGPTIRGQEIEEQFRSNTAPVDGTGAMPETTTCPSGEFSDSELVTCHFRLEDGTKVELLITPRREGTDWRLEADVGVIE